MGWYTIASMVNCHCSAIRIWIVIIRICLFWQLENYYIRGLYVWQSMLGELFSYYWVLMLVNGSTVVCICSFTCTSYFVASPTYIVLASAIEISSHRTCCSIQKRVYWNSVILAGNTSRIIGWYCTDISVSSEIMASSSGVRLLVLLWRAAL